VRNARADGGASSDSGGAWTATVHALLVAGADPDVVDAAGATPLMWAARAGDVATVALLLKVSCQCVVRGSRGHCALASWRFRSERVFEVPTVESSALAAAPNHLAACYAHGMHPSSRASLPVRAVDARA
jgi:ankyrin repeat protein